MDEQRIKEYDKNFTVININNEIKRKKNSMIDLAIKFKWKKLNTMFYVSEATLHLPQIPYDKLAYYVLSKDKLLWKYYHYYSENKKCMMYTVLHRDSEIEPKYIFLKTRPKGKITAKKIADICQDDIFDIAQTYIDKDTASRIDIFSEPIPEPEVKEEDPTQAIREKLARIKEKEDKEEYKNMEIFVSLVNDYKFHLRFLGSSYYVSKRLGNIIINKYGFPKYSVGLEGFGTFSDYTLNSKSISEYIAPTLSHTHELRKSDNNNCIYFEPFSHYIMVKNLYVSWNTGSYKYGDKLTAEKVKHICEDYIN